MTEAPAFKCSVCGAPAKAGDFSCQYCAAGIATLRCTRCLQMNMAEARRCSGCGCELGLIADSELSARRCSECRSALEVIREPAGTLLACGGCGGQFVEHALLRSLLEQYETTGLAFSDAPNHKPIRKLALERVRYRPCTVCQQMMNRKNFGSSSGVIVDVCAKHGTWFDAGELAQVLEFVRSGGLVRERVREEERKRWARVRERNASEPGPPSFDSLSISTDAESHPSFAADLLDFIVDTLSHH